MEMTIGKFVYEDYPDEEYEDSITIEVTDRKGNFITQYDVTTEGNEIVDYSGIDVLDSDDIAFLRALGFGTSQVETD
ncbi:MAG: hypothetical protein SNH27_15660 [Rikenellaceae bacterium]